MAFALTSLAFASADLSPLEWPDPPAGRLHGTRQGL